MTLAEIYAMTRVEEVFAVLQAERKQAANGAYALLQLGLGDNVTIKGKIWQYTGELPEVGTVIKVIAGVDDYRGEKSLNIKRWNVASSEQYKHLLEVKNERIADQKGILQDLFDQMPDDGYKQLTIAAITQYLEELETAPAAKSNHHNYPGGLLQHSIEVAQMALQQALGLMEVTGREYNLGLVIGGGLLHDIGKAISYSYKGPAIILDPIESLLGHLVTGVLVIGDVAQRIGFSRQSTEVLMLQHVVASHHGKLEYGSPVLPMTPEAQLISSADMMSMRTEVIANITKPENSDVTDRIYTLDGARVFTGYY